MVSSLTCLVMSWPTCKSLFFLSIFQWSWPTQLSIISLFFSKGQPLGTDSLFSSWSISPLKPHCFRLQMAGTSFPCESFFPKVLLGPEWKTGLSQMSVLGWCKWQAIGREGNTVFVYLKGARVQKGPKEQHWEPVPSKTVTQLKKNSLENLSHYHCQISPLKDEVLLFPKESWDKNITISRKWELTSKVSALLASSRDASYSRNLT